MTPGAGEYVSDANTVLLLHLNNNVTDSSSNAFAVTNSGVTFVLVGGSDLERLRRRFQGSTT